MSVHAWICGGGDGKARRAADGIAPDIEALVEAVHDVHEPNGVDVEDRRGVGIVAHLGRVAGEAKDIFQADGGCAQQVALDAEYVAIAAGVVQDRLDADLLLDLHAKALRAHPRTGPRRVGHVDRVDTVARQQRCPGKLLLAIEALGRNNLHHRDEFAVGNAFADTRPLAQGRRLNGRLARCIG